MRGMKIFQLIALGFTLSFVVRCVEPFNPPQIEGAENLLVIDASINGTTGSGKVVLRNSSKLGDNIDSEFLDPATVKVEDEGGNTYEFIHDGNGLYQVDNLFLNYGDKLKLTVNVRGNVYQSEFVEFIETPEIDDVSWSIEGNGVQFYVSTHDPDDKSIYYKWDYEETWEFAVPYPSGYEWVDGKIQVRPNYEDVYLCYRIVNPGTIQIGTSENLEEDVISEYPFAFISNTDGKFSRRYSMLIKQRALRKTVYDYWKSLKLNTEGLGGLFDPQPYAIESNITNVNNSDEDVLGYFHVYSETEKRVFISRKEVDDLFIRTGFENCKVDSVLISSLSPDAAYLLHAPWVNNFGVTIGYLVTTRMCGDCRVTGTSEKPDYW